MPHVIYRRTLRVNTGFSVADDSIENGPDQLVAVCDSKDVAGIVAQLNAETAHAPDTAQLIELKKQRDNVSKKMDEIRQEKVRVNPQDFPIEVRATLKKLNQLASVEVDRKLNKLGETLKSLNTQIRRVKEANQSPYYSVKVKKLKAGVDNTDIVE